ncbi:hypothetical protein F900_01423 [Acinetobacter modestus]|uniref:Uncharacterized protein n=1 Tax=Acinetobacter modestus TaxID=1776740 RepID=N9LZC6_9GAMM|nr:hypothetical protein [Acinetobacter modestus]ENX01663.1 hypothetical protein F900_01423 [Acinetobacter modestus]
MTTNFLDAIEAGVKSATNREENFIEIHKLFYDVKKQLEDYTKNLLILEMFYDVNDEDGEVVVKDYFIDDQGLYLDKKLFLSLRSSPNMHYYFLTNVALSKNGYPCSITIDGDKFDAMDKAGLEENLKNLLASPDTGQKIFQLMKLA